MARLPIVGSDDGTWGGILNTYLEVEHSNATGVEGTHKAISVPQLSLATDDAFKAKLTADTQYRFVVNADGALEWGAGGVTAPDTNLYRSGANALKTDDSLEVAGTITQATVPVVTTTGTQTLSNKTIAAPAVTGTMTIDTDTNLYRSAADTLTTDDIFRVIRGAATSEAISVKVVADTQNRFYAAADGKMWWGSGAAAQDTNLYRSAADTLKTDDTFDAAVLLQAGVGVALTTHTHSLDNLSDVVITTPATGQSLTYDGTNWVNGTGSGGSATFLGINKWLIGGVV